MTTRDLRIKGEQLRFLAHDDESEQLITGTATGETPTGWNFKIEDTYVYWVDNDGNERRKEGSLTGGSRAYRAITVHGELLYYGDINGDERSVSAANTFYPDAHPESTSVDGMVGHQSSGLSWADLIAAAGSIAEDDDATEYVIYIQSRSFLGSWRYLYRSIFLFDVSALSGQTVTSATFRIKASLKSDLLGITPNVNLYSSAPATDTALVAGDFDSLGTTPYCDTPVEYADWTNGEWIEFELNADGLAALQAAIDGDGIFKTGLRNANYDVAGVEPNWNGAYQWSYLIGQFADGSSPPELIVE